MVVGAGPAGLFWHCNCNSQKVVTLNQFYWIKVERRGRDIDLEPSDASHLQRMENPTLPLESVVQSDDTLSTRFNS
jgi:hypothetical protein